MVKRELETTMSGSSIGAISKDDERSQVKDQGWKSLSGCCLGFRAESLGFRVGMKEQKRQWKL